jgi:antitoxin VapB
VSVRIDNIGGGEVMETGVAKVFTRGCSQIVRLPRGFRIVGSRVRVRRMDNGILLEPIITDVDAWFAELDRFGEFLFMENGRQQPPMPPQASLD